MKIDEVEYRSTGQNVVVAYANNNNDQRGPFKRNRESLPATNGQVGKHGGSVKRMRLASDVVERAENGPEAERRSATQLISAALRKQFEKPARGGWSSSVQAGNSELDRLASGVSRLATYRIELTRSTKSDGQAALNELRSRYANLATYGNAGAKKDGTKPQEQPSGSTVSNGPAATREQLVLGGFVVEPVWRNPVRVGCGLNNLVNTCYMNSVLQVLSYTPPLVNFMQAHHAPAACRAPSNRLCMLCVLRQHVTTVHNSSRGSISPTQFVSSLKAVAKHFRHNSQEDAHEYLRLLLDRLQQDALVGSGVRPGAPVKPNGAGNAVVAIYGGTLRSQVACKSCAYVSTVLDPFLDLSLDIRAAARLEDALARFFAPEVLRDANAYRCERCKQKVEATKRFKLHSLPVVLTVHLKRFSAFGFSKVNKPIAYSETLDLATYRDSERSPGSNAIYKLFAVIAHLGNTPQSGHYVAYARTTIDSPQWYKFDDSRVSSVPRQIAVNNPSAYVLFYAKLFNTRPDCNSDSLLAKSPAGQSDKQPVPLPKHKANGLTIGNTSFNLGFGSIASNGVANAPKNGLANTKDDTRVNGLLINPKQTKPSTTVSTLLKSRSDEQPKKDAAENSRQTPPSNRPSPLTPAIVTKEKTQAVTTASPLSTPLPLVPLATSKSHLIPADSKSNDSATRNLAPRNTDATNSLNAQRTAKFSSSDSLSSAKQLANCDAGDSSVGSGSLANSGLQPQSSSDSTKGDAPRLVPAPAQANTPKQSGCSTSGAKLFKTTPGVTDAVSPPVTNCTDSERSQPKGFDKLAENVPPDTHLKASLRLDRKQSCSGLNGSLIINNRSSNAPAKLRLQSSKSLDSLHINASNNPSKTKVKDESSSASALRTLSKLLRQKNASSHVRSPEQPHTTSCHSDASASYSARKALACDSEHQNITEPHDLHPNNSVPTPTRIARKNQHKRPHDHVASPSSKLARHSYDDQSNRTAERRPERSIQNGLPSRKQQRDRDTMPKTSPTTVSPVSNGNLHAHAKLQSSAGSD